MTAIRQAEATWHGDLATGMGAVSAASSEAFAELPLTWLSRTGAPDGRTSPEELLAAAHASCYLMALASDLAKAGTPPSRLAVGVAVTADRVDGRWTVISSALDVRGRVPSADAAAFQAAAEAAKDGCPISRALRGNIELSVRATLEA